ncbi:P-loop NTPase fold protein [Corynebacterium sp. HMSC074C01]|uniref:KAP family P-loop NTPase fold protein n=1 Tax=Corynebacterium sp. HMSC074C01 TaxID=1739482 RepID=UPI0008A5733E|nr:P-loop NTPase fold protein [Corynebacterium sp. HMSC074C01]
MERVAQELESNETDPWKIARFTPWAVDSPEDLIGEFYQSLGEAIDLGGNEKFQKMAARGVRFAGLFAGMVPVAGGAITATSDAVADFLERPRSWNSLFNDVSEVVREKGYKVLVVADDIDRLQKSELYSLLKVIRLLGRFPGITFLLSMDAEAIGRGVGADISPDPTGAEALGLQYLEKYIQYRITVPPLTEFQKTKLIHSVLSYCEVGSKFKFDLSSYEIYTFIQNWLRLPITIRTAQRFGHQLRSTLTQLDPVEVSLIDVLNLQLLQTVYPYVYARLPNYKKVLTNSECIAEEDQAFLIKRVIEGVPGFNTWVQRRPNRDRHLSNLHSRRSEAEVVASVLQELFPALDRLKSAQGAGSERISDHSHFDRYFTLSIGGDDFSEIEAERVLFDASKGESFEFEELLKCEEATLRYVIANRLELSFKRLEPELSPEECSSVLMAAIHVLSTRGNLLDQGNSWVFWLIVDLMTTARRKLEEQSILRLLKFGERHKDVGPRIARRVLEKSCGDLPPEMVKAFAEYGKLLVSSLVEDMAKGDRAPIRVFWRIDSFIFLYKLCEDRRNFNLSFDPRAEFRKAFESEKFSAEDFASRFVSVDPLAVADSGKDEYRVDTVLMNYFRDFDDSFFEAPTKRDESVDANTWDERKEFVQGRCGKGT